MTTTDQATLATVDDLIATMVERIAEAVQPIQIRLFGSRARGEADQWSDVDLLVVLDEAPDRPVCQIEIKSLLTDVPIGIDVVVTTPGEIVRRGHVAGTVLNNALEEGKLIYEAEDAHRATALEWLNAAREDVAAADLILAQLDQPPGLAGPVCWHAQQIVEKSLKAVLFLEQIGGARTNSASWPTCWPSGCATGHRTWNGRSSRASRAAIRTMAYGPRPMTRTRRCPTRTGSMAVSLQSFSSAQSSLNLWMSSAHRPRTAVRGALCSLRGLVGGTGPQ